MDSNILNKALYIIKYSYKVWNILHIPTQQASDQNPKAKPLLRHNQRSDTDLPIVANGFAYLPYNWKISFLVVLSSFQLSYWVTTLKYQLYLAGVYPEIFQIIE